MLLCVSTAHSFFLLIGILCVYICVCVCVCVCNCFPPDNEQSGLAIFLEESPFVYAVKTDKVLKEYVPFVKKE